MRASAHPIAAAETEFDRFVAAPGDRELEVKFETDAKGLRLARQADGLAPQQRPKILRSVYFDTPSRDLWKRRIVLRVRRDGRRCLMGLKWPAAASEGLFARGEVEAVISGPTPDVGRFDPRIGEELRRIVGGQALEPQFETRFKRYLHTHAIGGTVIEAALDEGSIVAGDRTLPLRELELELKSGDEATLYEFAVELAEALPLRLATISKAERGFLLRTGHDPAPVRGKSRVLSPDTNLDEAIGAVLAASAQHFAANLPALEISRDSEAVHQMRVALRRLRTALRAFDDAAPCAAFAGLEAEAKRIASSLGDARNWDVFIVLVESGPLARFARDAGFDALMTAAADRRAAAYAAARDAIAAPATTRFLLGIQSFIARREWRSALSGPDLERLTEPARRFAARELDRLHKRALKRGKGLVHLAPRERHRLRIALKRLRYTAEFFSGVFEESGSSKACLRAVSQLQDTLGAANDTETAEQLLASLAGATGDAGAKAAGIVLGWHGRGAVFAERHLRKQWKAFRRAEPFWR